MPFWIKEYFQKRSQKHRQKRKMAMSSNNAAHIGIMRIILRERNAVKVACSVLRGGRNWKESPLPDTEEGG